LTTEARNRDAFRPGLLAFGSVEGQTLILEERWAEGTVERLPDHAAEPVRFPIPIVVASGDAVGLGLIANLARPGGNITGLTTGAVDLSAKRLKRLKEAVPAASCVAVLAPAENPNARPALQERQGAAPASLKAHSRR
jgi:putative ABC transport system substrate-binding protein